MNTNVSNKITPTESINGYVNVFIICIFTRELLQLLRLFNKDNSSFVVILVSFRIGGSLNTNFLLKTFANVNSVE